MVGMINVIDTLDEYWEKTIRKVNSQFYITTKKRLPDLDRTNAIIGIVEKGKRVA